MQNGRPQWISRALVATIVAGMAAVLVVAGAPAGSASAAPGVPSTPSQAGSPAKGTDGPLSPRLATLARPAVAVASDALQDRAVGLPEDGPASLVRRPGGRVHVNVRVAAPGVAVESALERAGAEILAEDLEQRTLTVAIAADDLAALAVVPGVEWAEEVLAPLVGSGTGAGPDGGAATSACGGGVVSEADTQLAASLARATYGVDGSGVRVGILSDSFDNLGGAAANVTAGELPGPGNPCGRTTPVTVQSDLASGGSDEGRAMAQLVFDLAPGSPISFASAFVSDVDFANQIRTLSANGAKVIVDDISYFNEPVYQDGIIAKAISDVTADGTVYFSSAGNGTKTIGGRSVGSYEAPVYRPATCPSSVSSLGLNSCHDYDTGSGTDTGNRITIPNGGRVSLKLGYDQPEYGITTDFDIALVDATTGSVVASSVANNLSSQKAYELMSFTNSTGASRSYDIVVGRYGTGPVARFKTIFLSASLSAVEYDLSTGGDTVGPVTYGHNNMTGSASVAAVPYNNSGTVESYSSRGPSTYCHGPVSGTTPAAPLPACVTEHVDVAATDGAANSFFGQLSSTTWRFYGTSAAAPHAAAVAALQRQARPCRTPAEVLAAQRASGRPVGAFGIDAVGSGLLDAGTAIGGLAACTTVPGAPASASGVPGNGTASVTWAPPAADGGSAVTGYEVTPVVGTTAQTPVSFDASATARTLTGLVNGTTYTFQVRAVNQVGTGPATTSGPVTVGAPLAPGYQSANPGNGTAVVSWFPISGNGSPITGYVVTPVVGSTPQTPVTFASTATSQTLTGLTNGATVSFHVAAVNARGTGPVATTTAIVIGAPARPAFPSITPGNGSARLGWLATSANGSPITGYVITPYLGTTAQAPRTFASAATAQTVTGLTNGSTYTFAIAAVNAVGTGPTVVTAAHVVGIPSAPALQSAIPGNGSAKVQWWPPSGNGSPITGYVITPSRGSTVLAPVTFASTTSNQTITGLTNGLSYTFKIQAVNALGTGPAATTAAVTVGAPAPPVLQSAIPGIGSAKVQWWPQSGNGSPVTGYVITPYIGSTAQSPLTFSSTAANQTISGLTNGVSYTFKIQAVNALGIGGPATTAAIVVGAPTAPSGVAAVAGAASATVSWTPGVDNGSSVTGYVITPFKAGVAQTPVSVAAGSTSVLVSGLTTGASYTFKVAAVNGRGTGPQSAASAAVVPT